MSERMVSCASYDPIDGKYRLTIWTSLQDEPANHMSVGLILDKESMSQLAQEIQNALRESGGDMWPKVSL